MLQRLLCGLEGPGVMINQRVDLYQERFKTRRIPLSARQSLVLLAVLLVLGASWSYLVASDLRQARQQNLAIKFEQGKIAQEMNAANVELNKLLADSRKEQQIASVARDINARKKVLSFVDANQFGSGQGFSNYLVALARLQVVNVWLDEISLAENFVKIRGSALDAELVPEYFNRFSEQTVFQGQRFDIFQLNRKAETDWKIDFEIATREGLK